MAEAINRPHLRVVHSAGARTIARVDLSHPESAQKLANLATDWLYERCSDEGKRKLLREHRLLATT